MDADRDDLLKNFYKFKNDLLKVNANYNDSMDAITIRELYDEGSGCSITGTIEQLNNQNMEQLKLQISSTKSLGDMKVKKVEFGEPKPHGKGVFFIVLGVILSIVVFVVIVMCCCRFGKKLKNRIFKKEISYEMYGEFRDEGSSAK